MIEFSIPDFWQMSLLNSFIINIKNNYPEFFNEDIEITSSFGSFPCIWNGTRGLISGIHTKSAMLRILEFFNSNNISIRHTFTNRCLKNTDVYDHNANQICELTCEVGQKYNIQNGCTIYDQNLEEYIRKTYPDLQIIYSTTKELSTVKEIDEYSEKGLVIPSYNLNHNMDILKQLKHPENIELLCVEQGCFANCPNREKHKDFVSKAVLNEIISMDELMNEVDCPLLDEPYINWYQWCNNPDVYISIDQIRTDYLSLGFNKFKIAGRGQTNWVLIDNIESYLNFFIKPKYQNFMRVELLNLTLGSEAMVPAGALNM